jgi:hypothetical protein
VIQVALSAVRQQLEGQRNEAKLGSSDPAYAASFEIQLSASRKNR